MRFEIDPRIVDEYPGVRVGAVTVRELDNTRDDPALAERFCGGRTERRTLDRGSPTAVLA